MDAPALKESDVSRWVGAASYDRGRRYARDGAISHARREGQTLRAVCAGSFPEPYRLHATLGAHGIASADCDCPVGDGGRCKHVAALLLAWLHHPEAFAETAPVEDVLSRRSPEELVRLIRQMIARHPDLEDLVAMPVPGTEPLDGRVVERQVRRIFSGDLYEWGSAFRVGRDLERIVRQGDGYAQAGDWASVATLCDVLLDSLLTHYEQLHDENGDLGVVVNECVDHLGRCLAHATDPEVRREAVRMLADVLLWDVGLGGFGMGDQAEARLREHATPAERAEVGARVDAALARLDGSDRWGASWTRKALGALRLALLPDHADDETRLRILRASGRTDDLVAHLLDLDRPDDALAAARDASDLDLVEVAPRFVDAGHGDAIDALALDRLADDSHRHLVEWVKERACSRGDDRLARDLAERLFWAGPSVERYAEVLAFSATLGREDQARDALRERVRAEKSYALLTKIHLHDREPDAALALLRLPAKEWPWGFDRLRLRRTVAQAVAASRPEEAIGLYLDAVEHLVGQRGRPAYADAAQLLLAVRDLYRQRGRADDWTLLVAELRDAYRALRALQDEWTKAGL